MGITLERREDSTVIHLEGVVDIAWAAELKKLLLQAFAAGKEVRVAVDGATDLDVTAVQLLWAARRESKASGVRFALVGNAPESVTSALLHAGFEDFATTLRTSHVSGVDCCQS